MGVRRVISAVFLAAWGLYPTLALAQRQLVPTDQDVGVTTMGTWPHLHNGLLVGCDVYCEGAPILSLTDKLGNRQTVNLNIPGSDYVYVRDVAAGADSSLVAVGVALSGDSRTGTFIAWISPDRARQTITRTWPYSPYAVAVAADGTVWTAGAVMTQSGGSYLHPNTIRHYTSSGQLLASTIVSGARQHNGMWDGSGGSWLVVSGDKVGWFTTACQYFEFSFDDVQLGRYDCPPGMAFTQNGGIALSSADDVLLATKQIPLTVVALDRSTGNWLQVLVQQDSGKRPKHIYGFDGLTLVTNAFNNQVRRYSLSN